ncbi:ribose-5-phosphate isomerase RpiA [Paenibacillus filicis]|uniref:Ribose-5-phosphate isomerase A n=1 Tax=Paenibacillus filicis TaxID=669464 RepID=A0ABU9DI37_9BACL
MEPKRAAAEKAVAYIHDGMVVGLGTGTTAYWAIQQIGKRVQEGLHIRAIATSSHSESLARELGIPIVSFSEIDGIDLTIDGADEVDLAWNVTKGGGGALLREKIVASASKRLVIIVDESKLAPQLGRFPLPVEIVKFGHEWTLKRLASLGCQATLRTFSSGDGPYITDNGNYIADCAFGRITNPQILHEQINQIPGVVDNGLFIGMAGSVVVGYRDGSVRELEKESL